MKKILAVFMFVATSVGLVSAATGATGEAKSTYQAEKQRASADYKMAREKCNALSGNPKDVCVEEAKANEKKSNANAEAKYKNTDKERMKAWIAAADADYAVAKAKCGAKTGNEKDVCIEEAKAAQTKAKSDIKMKKEVGEAKSEASEEKSEANYKVAIEKCDALAGPAKDACVASTKSKYGK